MLEPTRMLYNVLLFAIVSVVVALPAMTVGATMQKVSLTAYPMALCNDGSPAFYYYSAPPQNDSDKWLIYMEDGGFCTGQDSCRARPRVWTTSADDVYPRTVEGTDLLTRGDSAPFDDFHHVYIGSCSSDFFLARRNGTFSIGGDREFFFRGYFIGRAVFDDLQNLGLSDGSDMVLAGTGAGGIGAINHAISFQQEGKYPELALLIDSAWHVNHDDIFREVLGSLEYQSDIFFEACKRTLPGAYNYPCCLSSVCLARNYLNMLNVSTFFITSSSDMFVVSLLNDRKDDHPNFDFSVKTNELSQQMNAYAGAMVFSMQRFLPSLASIFQSSCGQPGYFRNLAIRGSPGVLSGGTDVILDLPDSTATYRSSKNTGFWRNVQTQGTSLPDALAAWLRNSSVQRTYWDSCGGFLCNPTCPGSFEQKLKTPSLTETVEVIFLILAVASLVAPFLFKLFLVIQARRVEWTVFSLGDDLRDTAAFAAYSEYLGRRKASLFSVKTAQSCGQSLLQVLRGDEMQLAFKNVTVTVPVRKPKNSADEETGGEGNVVKEGQSRRKAILKNVTVQFQPKQLVAIMGPSGSGKTTFLHVLANRTHGYEVEVGLMDYLCVFCGQKEVVARYAGMLMTMFLKYI